MEGLELQTAEELNTKGLELQTADELNMEGLELQTAEELNTKGLDELQTAEKLNTTMPSAPCNKTPQHKTHHLSIGNDDKPYNERSGLHTRGQRSSFRTRRGTVRLPPDVADSSPVKSTPRKSKTPKTLSATPGRKRGRPPKQAIATPTSHNAEESELGFREIPSEARKSASGQAKSLRRSGTLSQKQQSCRQESPSYSGEDIWDPFNDADGALHVKTRARQTTSTKTHEGALHAHDADQDEARHEHQIDLEVPERLQESSDKLQRILQLSPVESVDSFKSHLLRGLTGRRPLVNMDDEYRKVQQLVTQTVLAGEGNSMLVIGPRGCGKTALVEAVLSDITREHGDAFITVRVNGFIHTDDKLALREIWRQLGREIAADEDTDSTRANYADTLTSLLALLAHSPEEEGKVDEISRSVVFVIDEFDLFASHPRQTLLYNLFDVAQSRNAPIAVLGLTTRTDIVESLEKRVKSRFGQRYVHLTHPRTFQSFREMCKSALLSHESKLLDRPASEMKCRGAWNEYVEGLFASDDRFENALRHLFARSKCVPTFLAACYLFVCQLSPSSIPTGASFIEQLLLPPDSKLQHLASLSDMELSLLIAGARLDVILDTDVCNFSMVYDEYVQLASRVKAQGSAAGQTAVGGGARVWGKGAAQAGWEKLVELELVLPHAALATGPSLTPRPTPYRILPKASGTAAGDPVDKIDHQRQQLFFFPQSRIFPVVPAHCSANHFPTLQRRLAHAITPSSTKHSYLASLDISLVLTRHRHYQNFPLSRITSTFLGTRTLLPLFSIRSTVSRPIVLGLISLRPSVADPSAIVIAKLRLYISKRAIFAPESKPAAVSSHCLRNPSAVPRLPSDCHHTISSSGIPAVINATLLAIMGTANSSQQQQSQPQQSQPTHVVGSQGRRGILPSASGRPAAIVNGSSVHQKPASTPAKDAEGKFPCEHCNKNYLHAKHLKRHLLRHTGVRPYSCGLCEDTFARSDILKRHFQKCSVRRGNPTGASHLTHSKNSKKGKGTPVEQLTIPLNPSGSAGSAPSTQNIQQASYTASSTPTIQSPLDLSNLGLGTAAYQEELQSFSNRASRANSTKRSSTGMTASSRTTSGPSSIAGPDSAFSYSNGQVTPDSLTTSGAATPYSIHHENRLPFSPDGNYHATNNSSLDLNNMSRPHSGPSYTSSHHPHIIGSVNGSRNDLEALFSNAHDDFNQPYPNHHHEEPHHNIKTEPDYSNVHYPMNGSYSNLT
ncbi:MAG: hypothetical protein LQ345_006135 [Seirophora villosa]|nr:MAG: hypothetical protein LQ345_006135 [Seirophora villosa]